MKDFTYEANNGERYKGHKQVMLCYIDKTLTKKMKRLDVCCCSYYQILSMSSILL